MAKDTECSFEIELLSGPQDGEILRLDSNEAIVGRAAEVDVSTPGDTVASERHARIRCDGEGISIEDLGSKCGTFVNGEKIAATCVLGESDIVRVGCTEFVCRLPGSEDTSLKRASKVAEANPGP